MSTILLKLQLIWKSLRPNHRHENLYGRCVHPIGKHTKVQQKESSLKSVTRASGTHWW